MLFDETIFPVLSKIKSIIRISNPASLMLYLSIMSFRNIELKTSFKYSVLSVSSSKYKTKGNPPYVKYSLKAFLFLALFLQVFYLLLLVAFSIVVCFSVSPQ